MTAALVVAALTMGVPAGACYSGLVLIPTADVVGEGDYSLEAQFDGVFARGGEDGRLLNTELGLTPSFEAGVDFDFSQGAETRLLLNAKYVAWTETESRPALALGLCNVGRHLQSSPYAVASRDFGVARGHLGVAGIEGTGRWFAGVDKALNDKLTLMADYTNGDENSSSVGFSYQLNDRLGITSGVIFPNAGGDTEFTVHLVFCDSFRHSGEGE